MDKNPFVFWRGIRSLAHFYNIDTNEKYALTNKYALNEWLHRKAHILWNHKTIKPMQLHAFFPVFFSCLRVYARVWSNCIQIGIHFTNFQSESLHAFQARTSAAEIEFVDRPSEIVVKCLFNFQNTSNKLFFVFRCDCIWFSFTANWGGKCEI